MNWFDILKAVRKVGSGGKEVTAEALAKQLTLDPAVASAWLGKFARWGYVLRVGRDTSRRGRPQTIYSITRWGMEFRGEVKAKVVQMPKRLKVANPKITVGYHVTRGKWDGKDILSPLDRFDGDKEKAIKYFRRHWPDISVDDAFHLVEGVFLFETIKEAKEYVEGYRSPGAVILKVDTSELDVHRSPVEEDLYVEGKIPASAVQEVVKED